MQNFIIKIKDHCHYTGKHRGAAHSICNLEYGITTNIPMVFHNGSNYDYHFVIRESVKKFEKQFPRLGENTQKWDFYSSNIKRS